MEVSGQLNAPATLSLETDSWFSLDRRLDGPQSCSGHGSKERKNFLLCTFDPELSSLYPHHYAD